MGLGSKRSGDDGGHSHHPRQARGWLLVVTITALLGACAPAAPSTRAPEGGAGGTSAPGTASDTASADRVVRGGTYVIGNHNDLVNFDTATLGGGIKLSVMGLVQSGLMKWGKATVVDPSKLACDLCESWTQIDPTTYEFKLRQGVRWHNVPPVNGRELVADDVKYTLERVQTGNFRNDPRFGRMQPRVATIASIETPDRYTVRIHLKSPDAVFLWNMGDPFLLMVAREQVEAEKDGILQVGRDRHRPLHPQGVQPEDQLHPGAQSRLLPPRPALSRPRRGARHPDNTTRFNAFRAKEIQDPGQSMDAEAKRLVERQHSDLFLGEVPGLTSRRCASTSRAAVRRPAVRRAINLAIDRQGVIDATRFGRAGLARWLPPATGQVATPENEVASCPATASRKRPTWRRLGACSPRSGYPNGFATELIANRSSNIPADGEVVIEQLRRNLNLDVKCSFWSRPSSTRS